MQKTPNPVAEENADLADAAAARFGIVAIGASAGGLEACRKLVASISPTSGFVYIIVQHLEPTHRSLLSELLGVGSRVEVREALDGQQVQPNQIYVIPPHAYLTLVDDHLQIQPPIDKAGARMPFDVLLDSLASEDGARGCCVVLSGNGADGAVGAAALKARGGVVIAQDPTEAEFPSMPASVIAAGVVDKVLRAGEIVAYLTASGFPHAASQPPRQAAPSPVELEPVLALVSARTGHDFSAYKPGTLLRRIQRRMALKSLKPTEASAYLTQLSQDRVELDELAADLLINVTAFFRDADAFDHIVETVIPSLLSVHGTAGPLRIWVAGCSTGEEAYSLGMVVIEALERAHSPVGLQIFATDLDPDAVAKARIGFYPEASLEKVSEERRERFFEKTIGGGQIKPELRKTIVFSVQDLLQDPPFSRLDLISCRNVLIYLKPEAQARILAVFHFALAPTGRLILGASETAIGAEKLFSVTSQAFRIYQRFGRPTPPNFTSARFQPLPTPSPIRDVVSESVKSRYIEICRNYVLDTYCPPAVLMTKAFECLYTLSDLDPYFRIPPGQPSFDLSQMAREAVRAKFRSVVEDVLRQGKPSTAELQQTGADGIVVDIRLEATLVPDGDETLVLVCFLDASRATDAASTAKLYVHSVESGPHPLEAELLQTRQDLQAALRNLQSLTSEQKAINEEALSVQEEYQSTNEELLTSKEELQSLNEEQIALNSQLQESLEREKRVSSDLENVLCSTNVATLFLDKSLKIQFFTPATKSLFNLIPSDIGRPLADLKGLPSDDTLIADASNVLEKLEAQEGEIKGAHDTWFQRRISPYVNKDKSIDGVVITWADTTLQRLANGAVAAARNEAEQANHAKSRFLAAASHDLRQPLQTLALIQGLLLKSVTAPSDRKLVERLDETLGAMTGMLNTLLDINQMEAGAIRPEISTFALGDLMSGLADEFTYLAHAKRLELRIVKTDLDIVSDPRLLEQILRNLVSNALKYTESGKILIGCRRVGTSARIEVWDTGIGIPKAALQAIFEEYHQIGNEARERSKGMGLGLSIAQRFSALLGHRIEVRSRLGEGSVFSIETPIGEAPSLPIAVSKSGLSTHLGRKRRGSILVVEDDVDVLSLLNQLLEGDGHYVRMASDGLRALEEMSHGAFKPDLVILDYNLPQGMDGLETYRRLKAQMKYAPDLLILTGDISTRALNRINDATAARLAKPVKAEALLSAVQSILVQREIRRGVEANAAADSSTAPATIFIVDDDAHLRDGLREIIEAEGKTVQDFASCQAFLDKARSRVGDILLLDASLPGMSGIDLIKRLAELERSLPTIVITGEHDVTVAVRVMKAGALDLIEKPIGRDDLLAAIDRALDISREAKDLSAWRNVAAQQIAGLTLRQRQVMTMVLAGEPSKNIAADLGISQRTVENHRASIMLRTGAKSLPALARLAMVAAEFQKATKLN